MVHQKKSVLSMGQSRIYRHNIKTTQTKIIGHPKQTPSVQMLERYIIHASRMKQQQDTSRSNCCISEREMKLREGLEYSSKTIQLKKDGIRKNNNSIIMQSNQSYHPIMPSSRDENGVDTNKSNGSPSKHQ
jgi:hypothetical protein